MSETMSYAPVPEPVLAPNQFEFSPPRNAQGERIGTGAVFEQRRKGASSETVGSALLKALSRTTRSMQAPRGIAEQAEARTGLSFFTEQEREMAAARKQEAQTPTPAQKQPDSETTQLVQADKQQAEKALDATRSALKSAAAAQAAPANPQPQDRNEGVTPPAERKAHKEPETETIVIRSLDGRHVIGSFTAPKNATRAELDRAAQAAGLDYKISPLRTTLHGLGIRGKDMLAAFKKAWQASAPPEATQK